MKSRIIVSIVLIFGSWGAGLLHFIDCAAPKSLNNQIITEAIVVFTGGRLRIKTGLSLLKDGYAPILFISGVISPRSIEARLILQGINPQQVIYDLKARNTKDNAAALKVFTDRCQIKSLRLVTSAYHMPRALAEINKLFSSAQILIVPHPVLLQPPNYRLLFKEYHKYLLVILSGALCKAQLLMINLLKW